MADVPGTPELHTARLRLRPFAADDWMALREYVTREDVMQYDRPWPAADEELQRATVYLATHAGYWAICLRGSAELIGHVVCTRAQPADHLTWDLGIALNLRYHGRGYALEACRRVLRFAFEGYGARRVTATCHPDNARAWRLLERLGMRREAHHRQSGFLRRDEHGEPVWSDAYEYALLTDEWRGAAPATALPPAAP